MQEDSRYYTDWEGSFAFLRSHIDSGSFGHVFVAHDANTRQKVAIKIQSSKEQSIRQQTRMLLEHEASVLQEMVCLILHKQFTLQQSYGHVPRFIAFGKEKDKQYLASQLLGPSLEDLLDLCNPGKAKGKRIFSFPTILVIGILALRVVHAVHVAGYVHRDIKPENLLMGLDSSRKEVSCTPYM